MHEIFVNGLYPRREIGHLLVLSEEASARFRLLLGQDVGVSKDLANAAEFVGLASDVFGIHVLAQELRVVQILSMFFLI